MTNPLAGDLEHVLAHTRGYWEEVRGKRVFFTGATGFYGCWLLESFLHANDRLGLNTSAVVLTRDAASFRARTPHLAEHPAVQVIVGDVRAFEFPEGPFSHIVHAATDAASKHITDRLGQLDVITSGTRRTLDFARHCGAKGFLLASSGAVYGRQPPEVAQLDEEYLGGPDPLDPAWSYGEGKRLAEMYCALYARQWDIEPKIARGFSFVGPYIPLDSPSAITNFIGNALRGEPITVKSDGTTRRTYLYGADLAIWLWTVLFKGAACRPYNVGSEHSFSVADIARAVAAAFQGRVEVHIAQAPDPDRATERYIPSVARATRELGLVQTVALADAIARTVAWHQRVRRSAA